MPKRNHSQTTKSGANPLSDARRVQDSAKESGDKARAEPLSKADLKAKELWHRKSGIGYHLFVEYYGLQPRGVVYDDSDEALMQSQSVGHANGPSSNDSKQGRGMSRAAKRRKKKNSSKQKNDASTELPQADNDNGVLKSAMSPKFQAALQDKPQCKVISNMLSSMSVPLPLTLRIRHPSFVSAGLKSEAVKVIQQLESKFSNLVLPVSYDSSKNTIYQAKQDIRLTKFLLGKISPELKSVVVEATASGIMARQELGSMLPVIALAGIKKMTYGAKVLDMCASPGSKTLQALEVIATSPDQPPKRKPGRIVANDVHPLRLESLKDAIQRSGVDSSLTGRIVYTNHDASKFPTPKSGKKFDCIICDVPCSGDGTIRKDPHILPGWMPSISNSLHELQLNILKRAIKLLKLGGVVAYSTCSMNPIEDEAVVASSLAWANRFHEDSAELLTWPVDALPGFKYRPGVTSWRVGNYHWGDIGEEGESDNDLEDVPSIQWYETFEAASSAKMPHASPTMWPGAFESTSMINLPKCTRLLPQDNDTGGFFVALIRKNKEIEIDFTCSDRSSSKS